MWRNSEESMMTIIQRQLLSHDGQKMKVDGIEYTFRFGYHGSYPSCEFFGERDFWVTPYYWKDKKTNKVVTLLRSTNFGEGGVIVHKGLFKGPKDYFYKVKKAIRKFHKNDRLSMQEYTKQIEESNIYDGTKQRFPDIWRMGPYTKDAWGY